MRTNILYIIAALLVVLVLVSMMPRSEGFASQTSKYDYASGNDARRARLK